MPQQSTTLITGGTTGIGAAAAAELLAGEGHHVIATGRNPDTLAAARERFRDLSVDVVQSDAADLSAMDALVQHITDTCNGLDGAFLNAGIAPFAPLDATDTDTFDRLFHVNVKGPYFLVQKLLPLMKNPSSLVFNTSVVANVGMPNASAYSATKGAVQSIMRVLAVELSARGIRSNAVAPGPIETPIYGKLGMSAEEARAMGEHLGGRVPLGRFGTAEETARVAVFLLTSASAYVNGAEFTVDGGLQQNVL